MQKILFRRPTLGLALPVLIRRIKREWLLDPGYMRCPPMWLSASLLTVSPSSVHIAVWTFVALWVLVAIGYLVSITKAYIRFRRVARLLVIALITLSAGLIITATELLGAPQAGSIGAVGPVRVVEDLIPVMIAVSLGLVAYDLLRWNPLPPLDPSSEIEQ